MKSTSLGKGFRYVRRTLARASVLVIVFLFSFVLAGCDDKAAGDVDFPTGFDVGDSPMAILDKDMPGLVTTGEQFNIINAMGINSLAYIMNMVGLLSAATIIVASLVALLVVNYPKTVAQTKQRIVHVLFTVILMAAQPLLMDVVLSILLTSLK